LRLPEQQKKGGHYRATEQKLTNGPRGAGSPKLELEGRGE
jgi:hypothetical protein